MLKLLIVAMLIEALWETLKMTWQDGKVSVDRIGALILGILLAIGAGLDLLAMVEIELSIPYLGLILTGILISRGANFVHDIYTQIANINR